MTTGTRAHFPPNHFLQKKEETSAETRGYRGIRLKAAVQHLSSWGATCGGAGHRAGWAEHCLLHPREVQETAAAHGVFSRSDLDEGRLMDDFSSLLSSTTQKARTQNQQCWVRSEIHLLLHGSPNAGQQYLSGEKCRHEAISKILLNLLLCTNCGSWTIYLVLKLDGFIFFFF